VKIARRRPVRGSDSPVAVFAGILDGQRLWLAIEDRPGSLALRDAASGDVIAPENEVPDDQPGYRSARVDLGELPGDAEATYDVVLVPSGGRTVKPVWSEPLPGRRPRVAEDGRTQYWLNRTDEGMLQVRRGAVDDAAELRAVEVTDGGLLLTVAGTGRTLALLAEGEPVVTFPTSATGPDTVTATMDAASLPAADKKPTQVAIGEPGAWLPVRRRANDLAEPGRGAPLPQIQDEHGRGRLRLRWSPGALLMARLLDPEADA
jgi:hypothetical protein